MGGHLVHLLHWIADEAEHGGPFAVMGIVLGAIVGYLIDPIMQPSEVCESNGLGKDTLGNCPDLFTPEALVVMLGCAAALGAIGWFISWAAARGNTAG